MANATQSEWMMERMARMFRTLGEPVRLRILHQLEAGEQTVGEVVEALEGNQPNISKHLSILHQAGLVSRRREGVSMVYGIGDPMVFRLCELVCRSETRRGERELEELRASAGGRKR